MAAEMILSGDADIVVAGGMENMSMAPYAMMKGRYGYRMGNATLVDTMVNDALWDAFNNYHMGITAENICDQWGLTGEELDKFAAGFCCYCESLRDRHAKICHLRKVAAFAAEKISHCRAAFFKLINPLCHKLLFLLEFSLD